MAIDQDVTVPLVRLADLCPYVSFLALQIEDLEYPERVFDVLVRQVSSRRRVPGTDVAIVSSGLDDAASAASGSWQVRGLMAVMALLWHLSAGVGDGPAS